MGRWTQGIIDDVASTRCNSCGRKAGPGSLYRGRCTFRDDAHNKLIRDLDKETMDAEVRADKALDQLQARKASLTRTPSAPFYLADLEAVLSSSKADRTQEPSGNALASKLRSRRLIRRPGWKPSDDIPRR